MFHQLNCISVLVLVLHIASYLYEMLHEIILFLPYGEVLLKLLVVLI